MQIANILRTKSMSRSQLSQTTRAFHNRGIILGDLLHSKIRGQICAILRAQRVHCFDNS